MTFLIVSNERDLTSDFVIRELRSRNHTFLRLNTERLAQSITAFNPLSGTFEIITDDRRVSVGSVGAAYFRRPEFPKIDTGDAGTDQYVSSEWNALLKAFYIRIGDRWFSHPKDILLAEDKPSQLSLAQEIGFDIPVTVITNDFDEVARLLDKDPLIAKPLRQALVQQSGCDQVIFTSAITELSNEDRASLSMAPVIFQRHVAKKSDIRVTVVGNRVFATAILSQGNADTVVDWRKTSVADLPHEPIQLPNRVEKMCVEFVRKQNLRFGAIDLILGQDDKFWFLECNPNGQWAWIENRTGMPIASAIVDELEQIARE